MDVDGKTEKICSGVEVKRKVSVEYSRRKENSVEESKMLRKLWWRL